MDDNMNERQNDDRLALVSTFLQCNIVVHIMCHHSRTDEMKLCSSSSLHNMTMSMVYMSQSLLLNILVYGYRFLSLLVQ